jgi:hypothetical protein
MLPRRVVDSNQNLALSFDGMGDYLTTATAQFPIGSGTQTWSLWFELEDVTTRQALLTLRKDFDSGVELGVMGGALTAWHVYGDRLLAVGSAPLDVGKWHHAAYRFDTMSATLFVDGKAVATAINTTSQRTPTTCWIGSLDGTQHLLHGSIDDVRVFNVARSDEQIASEASGNFSAVDPGLVLELPLNEASGAVVYDHSTHENDGLLGDGIPVDMPARVVSGAPLDAD